MTTLYVKETGSCVRRVGQRLEIVKGGEKLASARLRDVERVVLFGNVELSGPAMCALLDAGIDVAEHFPEAGVGKAFAFSVEPARKIR